MATNKELVRELCRQIRGIATNYPDGMIELALEIDRHMPKPPSTESSLRFEPALVGGPPQWKPEPTAIAEPNGIATSVGTATIEQPKRKPGRPKKIRPAQP